MSLLSRLFGGGRRPATPAPSHDGDDTLVIVPIPPLIAILTGLEAEKGSALTEAEVLTARDNAVCMTMAASRAAMLAEARGYPDLELERAWEDWEAYRATRDGA